MISNSVTELNKMYYQSYQEIVYPLWQWTYKDEGRSKSSAYTLFYPVLREIVFRDEEMYTLQDVFLTPIP